VQIYNQARKWLFRRTHTGILQGICQGICVLPMATDTNGPKSLQPISISCIRCILYYLYNQKNSITLNLLSVIWNYSVCDLPLSSSTESVSSSFFCCFAASVHYNYTSRTVPSQTILTRSHFLVLL
jgi:hypothetical protein